MRYLFTLSILAMFLLETSLASKIFHVPTITEVPPQKTFVAGDLVFVDRMEISIARIDLQPLLVTLCKEPVIGPEDRIPPTQSLVGFDQPAPPMPPVRNMACASIMAPMKFDELAKIPAEEILHSSECQRYSSEIQVLENFVERPQPVSTYLKP